MSSSYQTPSAISVISRQRKLKEINEQMQLMEGLYTSQGKPSSMSISKPQNANYTSQISEIDNQMRLMKEVFGNFRDRQMSDTASMTTDNETTTTTTTQEPAEDPREDLVCGSCQPSPARGFKKYLFGKGSMKKAYMSQIDQEIASMKEELQSLKVGRRGSCCSATKDSTTKESGKDSKVRFRSRSPSWSMRSSSNRKGSSPAPKKQRNKSPGR